MRKCSRHFAVMQVFSTCE